MGGDLFHEGKAKEGAARSLIQPYRNSPKEAPVRQTSQCAIKTGNVAWARM